MSNPKEKQDEAAAQDAHGNTGDNGEHGHSGEGAASAMAHMISQDEQHRRNGGEPEQAAGGQP